MDMITAMLYCGYMDWLYSRFMVQNHPALCMDQVYPVFWSPFPLETRNQECKRVIKGLDANWGELSSPENPAGSLLDAQAF
ncbi:hypothetical protein AQUCO_00600458v1 [Aquilegia coerulea]|uniref:Uncharacterized protein n=1 Tax=Aquilegia coerulea TaxID=218851 RepID=A0A2G5EPQ7_AQUCA|nr:hypothetical protein AQUCO_00600458v1 [Aquilegia coerulea]